MKRKMHLVARVPNEGARLLAWSLGTNPYLWGRLNQRGINPLKVHRLLAGELTPGAGDGRAIFCVTGQLIRAEHWNGAPEGGWFDTPAQFAASEKRAA